MIYFFSATGNSRHVAERIAAALDDSIQSIEQAPQEVTIKEGEVLGIVTPTNWNELPVLVRAFIQHTTFTLLADNYVFTVATFGSIQGFVYEDARNSPFSITTRRRTTVSISTANTGRNNKIPFRHEKNINDMCCLDDVGSM